MNEISRFINGGDSFFNQRHPLLKLFLGGAFLAAVFLPPDFFPETVLLKLALLLLFGGLAGVFKSPSGWIRVNIFWGSFMLFLLAVTAGKGLVSQNELRLGPVLSIAGRSFWIVNVIFLWARGFQYRELIYLGEIFRVPRRITTQVLLIFIIFGKLMGEFRLVPRVWKVRGVHSASFHSKLRLLPALLRSVLMRTTRFARRLEMALFSRGFGGGLYTFFSRDWQRADTLTLGGALLILSLSLTIA